MGKRRRPLCAPPFPARTFQCTLDKFLSQKQLWRKPIAKDGSCLFRAVAEQVSLSQNCHHRVRLQCADYIRTHQDDFKEFLTMSLDEYLGFLTDAQLWGGEVELVALSKLYGRSIIVYNEQENGVQEQVFPCTEEERASSADDLANPILLAYSDGNHYDSVYTKAHKNNMAFCQAIVYSLFYERVVTDRIPLHCRQRLRQLPESEFHKLPELVINDHSLFLLSTHYSTESIAAMTSSVYHNVAADVYRREKDCKEQQDRCMAANIQFQVGDLCQVRLPDGDCKGEVTALNVSPGCHQVRVFQYQEEWEIPYKDMTLPTAGNKSYVRHSSATAQSGTRSRPLYPSSQQPHPQPPPSSSSSPSPSSSSRVPQPTPGRDTQPHNPAPAPGPAPKRPAQRTVSAGANSVNGVTKYREIPREKERAPPTQPREDVAVPRRSQVKPSGSVKLPVARSSGPEGTGAVVTSAAGRETVTKPAVATAGTTTTTVATSTTTTTATTATSALRSAVLSKKPSNNRDPAPTGIIASKPVTPAAVADTAHTKPAVIPQAKVTKTAAAAPRGSLGSVDPVTAKCVSPTSTAAAQTKPAVLPPHAKVAAKTAATDALGRLTPDDIIAPKLVSPITAAAAATAALQTGHAAGIPHARIPQKTPPQIPAVTSPRLTKTSAGPHGSLTSEDSNYSSSSDESNGNQSTNATPAATGTNNKAAGFPKRFAFPAINPEELVTGAWETDSHPVEAPRKPVPQFKPSLPKRGESQHAQREGGAKKESRSAVEPRLPTTTSASDGPGPYFTASVGKKSPSSSSSPFLDDKESPYLERKLPMMVESSQPEEAWPMFESEEPPNPLLQGLFNRASAPLNLPEGLTMPPGMPFQLPLNTGTPNMYEQFLRSLHVPMGHDFMPIGANPPLGHFPFLRAQTATSAREVQVSPSLKDQGAQTDRHAISVTSSETQTSLRGLSMGLIPSEELKPPQLEGRNESPYDQMKFILGYSIQCARVYLQNSPIATESRAKEVLVMMEKFREEGLKKILPQPQPPPRAKAEAKAKKDLKMKQLNSDEQTFIQSLSSGRLSTLPATAEVETRQPKPAEKQPGGAGLTAESDRLAKSAQQGSSKHVVHTQQPAVAAQAQDQATKQQQQPAAKVAARAQSQQQQQPAAKVAARSQSQQQQQPVAKVAARAQSQQQQLNKTTAAAKPVQTHPPPADQQPRPPPPGKTLPADQQPRPPPPGKTLPADQQPRPPPPGKTLPSNQQPRPPLPGKTLPSNQQPRPPLPGKTLHSNQQPRPPPPGKTLPSNQQPRPPPSGKVPTDQQPHPPPVTAVQETNNERHSPNHHAAKTHQPRSPAPPPSKQGNTPPVTTESAEITPKESSTPSPDTTSNGHSEEEGEKESSTPEGGGQPSELVPPQQEFMMHPYPHHPQMVPPHMMMHPGARPQLVMPMPMPPTMWYPNYHIPMAAMPVMVPPFAAHHPMMSHHMMQRGFEPHERSGQTDGSPSIQELGEDQEERPLQATEPSTTEERGIGEEATRPPEEGSPEEIAPEAVAEEEESRQTEEQPPSPMPFAAETTAGEEGEGEEEEGEDEEGGEDDDEEMTGPTSSPEPGETVDPLPEVDEAVGAAVVVTGVVSPEEQDTVPEGEKSASVTGTSAPIAAGEVRANAKSSESGSVRKSGSQRQHLPDLPCRPTKNRGPENRGGTRSRQSGKSERPKMERRTPRHLPPRSTPSTASAEGSGKEGGKDPKTYTSRESKPVKPQNYTFTRRAKATTAPAGDSYGGGRAGGGSSVASGGGGGGGRPVGRQQQPPQKQPPFVGGKDGQQKAKTKRYSNSGFRGNQDPTRGLFVSEEEDPLLPADVPSATQLPSFRANYSPTRPSRTDSEPTTYPSFPHTFAQDCSNTSNATDPWPSFESSTFYLAPSYPKAVTTDSTQCTTDCDIGDLKKQNLTSYKRRLEATSPYHSSLK